MGSIQGHHVEKSVSKTLDHSLQNNMAVVPNDHHKTLWPFHDFKDHYLDLLQTQLQLHHDEVGCTYADRGVFLGNTLVLVVNLRHFSLFNNVFPTRLHTCI